MTENKETISDILKTSETHITIVENPTAYSDNIYYIYNGEDHKTTIRSEEELTGFTEALKMLKQEHQNVSIESHKWETSQAWTFQQKTDKLNKLLKSADKLNMSITGAIAELPEDEDTSSVNPIGVSITAGPGVGVFTSDENGSAFDKLMGHPGVKEMFDSFDETEGEEDITADDSDEENPEDTSIDNTTAGEDEKGEVEVDPRSKYTDLTADELEKIMAEVMDDHLVYDPYEAMKTIAALSALNPEAVKELEDRRAQKEKAAKEIDNPADEAVGSIAELSDEEFDDFMKDFK